MWRLAWNGSIILPMGNSVVKGEGVGSRKNFGNSNYIRVVFIFGRVFNKLQTIKAYWNQSFLRIELFAMQSALDHNLLLWQCSLNKINTGLALISSKQTKNGNWEYDLGISPPVFVFSLGIIFEKVIFKQYLSSCPLFFSWFPPRFSIGTFLDSIVCGFFFCFFFF